MRQRLGQHFLRDTRPIHDAITALDLCASDTIIEIGPGRGALTHPLAEACAQVGSSLIAIERDETLAAHLKIDHPFELIVDDVRTALPRILSERPMPAYKLVGNLPYYLTGHFFRMLFNLEQRPHTLVVLIQKEVAERVCADPPRMNRLAASVQYWGKPSLIRTVPPSSFSPQPNVESALIAVRAHPDRIARTPLDTLYDAALKALFAQPRKTLSNNIATAIPKLPRADIVSLLNAHSLDPERRPGTLTVSDIAQIASLFLFSSPKE